MTVPLVTVIAEIFDNAGRQSNIGLTAMLSGQDPTPDVPDTDKWDIAFRLIEAATTANIRLASEIDLLLDRIAVLEQNR